MEVCCLVKNRITTMVKEFWGTGYHAIEFSRGNLSSRIYLHRLNPKNTIQVKKIDLFR